SSPRARARVHPRREVGRAGRRELPPLGIVLELARRQRALAVAQLAGVGVDHAQDRAGRDLLDLEPADGAVGALAGPALLERRRDVTAGVELVELRDPVARDVVEVEDLLPAGAGAHVADELDGVAAREEPDRPEREVRVAVGV